jgi:hypothetical protein
MVYQWKTGSRHKVSAAVAAEVMDRLAEEDRLNAQELVEESRPEDAPLHREFEWDDSVAAEKYREEQAGALIRHLVVRIEANDQEYPTRQYFMIQPEAKIYEPIQVILKDEDKTDLLLEQAKRELLAFKAKYACLKELAEVIKAIDAVA